jgi:hypothetical protein
MRTGGDPVSTNRRALVARPRPVHDGYVFVAQYPPALIFGLLEPNTEHEANINLLGEAHFPGKMGFESP